MTMFSPRPTIIYLTIQKAYFVDGKEKGEIDWNGRDMGALFKSLKEKTKNDNVRIILGNDLSYFPVLILPKSAKPEEIIQKANELIPEEISVSNSVFEIRGQNEKGENIIQVFAVASSTIQEIFKSALENNLNIEYLCSIISVFANYMPDKDKAILFIWSDLEKLALIEKNGIVYGSETISETGHDKIVELINYTKDSFNVIPTISYANSDVDKLIQPLKIEVKKISLDPFQIVLGHAVSDKEQGSFLIIKSFDQKNEAAKNISLTGNQVPIDKEDNDEKTNLESKKGSPLILGIILFAIILAAIGFFVYQLFFKK